MHKVNTQDAPALTPIKARTIEDVGRFTPTSRIDAPVAHALNTVYEFAVLNNISDIHMEFDDIDGLEMRVRINGDLQPFGELMHPDAARLAKTKVCAKAKLDDQERLLPQDGRMMLYFGGRRVDIRLAITPTVSGYVIVSRLLDSDNSNTRLDRLEVSFIVKEAMKHVISHPEGMVLMSGPTGSGKTTTLYALLRELKDITRHILTIENPVEYSVKTFTQIDIDNRLTFSKAMRAALRMDPDIIMVGEIRDLESAEIAVQAGQSGHMVLSTVHANSAVDTIVRLASLGLESYHISPVLTAVIAQRLIKRIPDDAQFEWAPPNEIEKEWLISRGVYYPHMKFPVISDRVLSGRIPIIEMIEINHEIRGMIDANASAVDIVEVAAKQDQFETLSQSGVRLALAGKTTLKQVMGATGDTAITPKHQRFEQKLITSGHLTIENLDKAQQLRVERMAKGDNTALHIIMLEQKFIKQADLDDIGFKDIKKVK